MAAWNIDWLKRIKTPVLWQRWWAPLVLAALPVPVLILASRVTGLPKFILAIPMLPVFVLAYIVARRHASRGRLRSHTLETVVNFVLVMVTGLITLVLTYSFAYILVCDVFGYLGFPCSFHWDL